MLYTYDPKMVITTFKGVIITGYADGTFLTVERTADMFSQVVGAQGETSRAKSNNRSGTAKLHLKQTSPSNDVLSAIALLDENGGLGVGPFMVRDTLGTTLIMSPQAYLKKYAHAEYSKDIVNREWFIYLTDVNVYVGGNIPTL